MGRRNKAAVSTEALVRMAMPVLQEAERSRPRTGRGDRPRIPDWLMAALIMIGILRRRKSKSAQYRYLREHRQEIAEWLGDRAFPARTTFFRRYRRGHHLYQEAIRLQGQLAIAEGVTDATDVAVDKSLVEALGPPWHQRHRKAGKKPAGVDPEAGWGFSKYHDWVYGFSFEVVVTSTPNSTVFPLLASVGTANASEVRTFAAKIDELPPQTRTVSADSGYDANDLGERVEYTATGRRTGRRFLCPENRRNAGRQKTKPCAADASRALGRQRRGQRRAFQKSPRGQRIYRRRGRTVEPFNQWLKSLFELNDRVWHRGLDNNRTQMLAAIFAYQLLARLNHRVGNANGRVRWILDAL